MKMGVLFIMVIFSSLCLGLVASSGLGQCPKIPTMESFNLTRFTGHWYEIERSFYLVELISSCVSVDLTQNARGNLLVSINTKSRWSGSFSFSQGIATPSRRDPSILIYKVTSKLPKFLNKYLPGSGFYQILHTDYDTYAVLYSCTNYQVIHTDLIWIWSRERDIKARKRMEIYTLLSERRIDSERLILPDNRNCSDY